MIETAFLDVIAIFGGFVFIASWVGLALAILALVIWLIEAIINMIRDIWRR